MSITATSPVDLAALAADLDTGGLAGHEAALQLVVEAARAKGISPVLVDLLADPHQPEVARLRAFGRVAATLSYGRTAVTKAPLVRIAA